MLQIIFLIATARLLKNKEYALVFALMYGGMIIFTAFLFSAGAPSGSFFSVLIFGVINFAFAYVYYLGILRLQDSLIVGIVASVIGAFFVIVAPTFLMVI